ncbi:MAG: hypothetical protein AAGB48_04815 [Planctomycetota bacterium]
MNGAKPWQIALIVLGLIGGIAGVVFALGSNSGPDMADSMVLVDIETGNLYSVSIKNRSVMTPMEHPDTGRRTLHRVIRDDEGGYKISRRRLGGLQNDELVNTDVVDLDSGRILVDNGDPTRISP